jgi:hypothetical protein
MKFDWVVIKKEGFVCKCVDYWQAEKTAKENQAVLAKNYYGRIVRIADFGNEVTGKN